MGQADVKRVLKQSGKWLISNEIAKKAGYSLKSIQSSLRRLVKWGEVKKEHATKVIHDEKRLKNRSFAGYAYKIKDIKTLDDFNFKEKKVLLRIDLNSDIENKNIVPNQKFKEHAKTIKELIEKEAKIIILSHQGLNPKDKNYLELKQHSELLSKEVGIKIDYVDDILGKEAEIKIKDLKAQQAIMLKNLISLKEERQNKPPEKHAKSELVKKLSKLADAYINDSFSLSYLSIASIVGFPKLLPSFAGRYLEHELDTIQLLTESKQPVVYVLGGKESKLTTRLMKNIVKNQKPIKVLTCGLFGQLCLLASGKKLGNQENILKQNHLSINSELKKLVREGNILLPHDLAIETFGQREEIQLHHLPVYQEIFDLGKESIEEYCKIIKEAKTIFLKGCPSYYQNENFSLATKEILNAISSTDAFCVIAGEETIRALEKFSIPLEKINHLSLSSNTLTNYLAEEKLPGIEALKITK